MLTHDQREALEWARLYRSRGLNPIPSGLDRKKPVYQFAASHGWDRMFPSEWFSEESWEEQPTTNLQVQTGRPWRLLVIDLDGEEARYAWRQWGRCPKTWTVHREAGDSWHLWFRLPADCPHPLPKRFLWKGEGKHQGIERLCDKSLIVAPPSFHVEHADSRYRFMGLRQSPDRMPLPAPCPQWVLDLKPIEMEKVVPAYVPPPARPRDPRRTPEVRLDREEVLGRIPDKRSIALDCGLRFTGHVSPDGWAECHAYSRPDARPSAAVNVRSGWYVDQGECVTLSPLDLMVATGRAHDWRDALERLAGRN